MKELKVDLASAQQTILSMTSIVDINQKLPTVDETLLKYQSIRDQQHADTCTTLKKLVKGQHKNWQKYYVAQVIHEVLFYGLMNAYKAVIDYKHILYQNVSELNMKYAIQCFKIITTMTKMMMMIRRR